MLDEEAQCVTIRIWHLIEGHTHPLDCGVVGEGSPEALVGLLCDQRGGQLAEELLVQAGECVYIVCLQQAWIVEMRQLALQLVHQHLVARGTIETVLFNGIGLLDDAAHVDNETRHIRMIAHIQFQCIEAGPEQRILGLLVQAEAVRLTAARARLLLALWRSIAVASGEMKLVSGTYIINIDGTYSRNTLLFTAA